MLDQLQALGHKPAAAREKGLYQLVEGAEDAYQACLAYVRKAPTDDVLDLVQLALNYFEAVVAPRYRGVTSDKRLKPITGRSCHSGLDSPPGTGNLRESWADRGRPRSEGALDAYSL